MSLELATLIIGVIAVIVSVVAAIAAVLAVRYSREQLAQGCEQLRLAREQAELRPEISLLLQEEQPLTYVKTLGMRYVDHFQAYVNFQIKNTGETAAHNVICKVWFDENVLEPVDYGDFHTAWMGPEQTNKHRVKVRTYSHGVTTISYATMCDEVGRVGGILNLEIPPE
jgi:hypothetical protein